MPIEESGFLLFTCGKREVSMVLVWLNIMIIVVTVTHKFSIFAGNTIHITVGDTTVPGPPASWNFVFLAKIPQNHSYISAGTIKIA